jgi:hypothetical protein
MTVKSSIEIHLEKIVASGIGEKNILSNKITRKDDLL